MSLERLLSRAAVHSHQTVLTTWQRYDPVFLALWAAPELLHLLVSFTGVVFLWPLVNTAGKWACGVLFSLRVVGSALALFQPERTSWPRAADIGTTLWLGQIVQALSIICGTTSLSDTFVERFRNSSLYSVGLYFEIQGQTHARRVLPGWLVLVLAEIYAIAGAAVYWPRLHDQRGQLLVAFQLTHVVLPWVWHSLVRKWLQQAPDGPAGSVISAPGGKTAGCGLDHDPACTAAAKAAPFGSTSSLGGSASVLATAGVSDGEVVSPRSDRLLVRRSLLRRDSSQPGTSSAHASGETWDQPQARAHSFMSQSSLAAAQQLVAAAPCEYESPLGSQIEACLKLNSGHEPSSLGHSAGMRIVHMLRQNNGGWNCPLGEHEVVNVAVRSGCILISMPLLLQRRRPASAEAAPTPAPPSEGAHSHPGLSEADALATARHLLPDLFHQLGLCGDGTAADGCGAQAGSASPAPGTRVVLQLGAHRVQATWGAPSTDVTLQVLPALDAAWGAAQAPRSGLLSSPADSESLSVGSPPASGDSGAALSSPPRSPRSRVPLPRLGLVRVVPRTAVQHPPRPAASAAGHVVAPHTWRVHVQLTGVTWAAWKMGLMLTGSDPSLSSAAATGSGGSSRGRASGADTGLPHELQLWAFTSHGYATVRVLRVLPWAGFCAGGAHTPTVAEVEVTVGESALLTHHAGGPVAACQPLTLQLWCGALLLNTTCLILDSRTALTPSSAPSPAPAAADPHVDVPGLLRGSPDFGWWGGVGSRVVQEGCAELSQVVDATWVAGEGGGWCERRAADARGLSAVHRDFLLLLHTAAEGAAQGGLCYAAGRVRGDTVHAAGHAFVAVCALNRTQATAVLTSLDSWAQRGQLGPLRRLLRALRPHICALPPEGVGPQPSEPAAPARSPGVLDAVHGFACESCETAYRQRLWTDLAQARALGSLCLIGAAYLSYREWMGWGENLCIALYIALHGVRLAQATGWWRPRNPWLRVAGVMTAAAQRAFMFGLAAAGVLVLCSSVIRNIHRGLPWLVACVLGALAEERIGLSAVLPAPWVLLFSLGSAVINYGCVTTVVGHRLSTVVGTAVTSVVLPLWAEVHLRRMLMPPPRAALVHPPLPQSAALQSRARAPVVQPVQSPEAPATPGLRPRRRTRWGGKGQAGGG